MASYAYSLNGENYSSDTYDTREAAIAAGIEDALDLNAYGREYTEVSVGRCLPYVPTLRASFVVEQPQEQAYDECGEYSEDWLQATREQENELGRRLTEVVNNWLVEIMQTPHFYTVVEVTVHEVPHE